METIVVTPAAAYREALEDLLLAGNHVEGRLGGMREIIGYTVNVTEPSTVRGLYGIRGRRLNPAIGALEALQLLGQVSLPEVHVNRVQAFEKFLDGGIFHGAYGQRVYGQFERLVETLEAPGSRQAILSIYDSRVDLGVHRKDIPCTLTLQFFIRDDEVCLRTSMRSNDAWLGLPYDLHQFINLQAAVAAHFDTPMGTYQHTVGSMHLYDYDESKARHLIRSLEYDEVNDLADADEVELLFEPGNLSDLSSWARRSLVDQSHALEETSYQTWMRRSVA